MPNRFGAIAPSPNASDTGQNHRRNSSVLGTRTRDSEDLGPDSRPASRARVTTTPPPSPAVMNDINATPRHQRQGVTAPTPRRAQDTFDFNFPNNARQRDLRLIETLRRGLDETTIADWFELVEHVIEAVYDGAVNILSRTSGDPGPREVIADVSDRAVQLLNNLAFRGVHPSIRVHNSQPAHSQSSLDQRLTLLESSVASLGESISARIDSLVHGLPHTPTTTRPTQTTRAATAGGASTQGPQGRSFAAAAAAAPTKNPVRPSTPKKVGPQYIQFVARFRGNPIPRDKRPSNYFIQTAINSRLRNTPSAKNALLMGVDWNDNGNCILFFSPSTDIDAILSLRHVLAPLIAPDREIVISHNTRWSTAVLGNVLVRDYDGGVHDSETILAALKTNPFFAQARITQDPRWLRPLEEISSSRSSVVVAFEDPDGSQLKALTKQRIFAFGDQLRVTHIWKPL
ncbi:hypothetical protein BV25DRAFT_1921833, partial [Artomyces pyxidatus]